MITEYEDKSVLLTIFEEISAKILADVTEISEVVIYSNQEANEAEQRPFDYPYVAIQMVIDWEPDEARGNNYDNPPINGAIGLQKKGMATIQIHTMFANRNDDTPAFIENEAIRHKVHRAIDLMDDSTGFYTALLKVQDQLPIEINGNQDFITTYVCAVKEGAIIRGTESTIPEIGVTPGSRSETVIN